METYNSVKTKIDEMGGFWCQYTGNSIGRAINYLYHICGLGIAERVTFMGNGTINLHNEKFADVSYDKGFPYFIFLKEEYNKKQKLLLEKGLYWTEG